MPVIAFASTKGGAGKSTASLLLAGELAAAGARIVLIDADLSRRPLVAWSKLPGRPVAIEDVASQGERTILVNSAQNPASRAPEFPATGARSEQASGMPEACSLRALD